MDKDSDDRQIKGLLDIILNSELSNAEIRPRGNCKFSVFRILGYLLSGQGHRYKHSTVVITLDRYEICISQMTMYLFAFA
jgi:hypothetical protein